jgi:geranylgeranyl diphosphate synthase type I
VERYVTQIKSRLNTFLFDSNVTAEFAELIWPALGTAELEGVVGPNHPIYWAQLPGLCCQAVGSDPSQADDFTAAWYCLFAAANLMDNIQDEDKPAKWWADWGPALALNVTTSLFFLGSMGLSRAAAGNNQALLTYYRRLMGMNIGQYQDLRIEQPRLDQYWSFVRAKSGDFFALACEGGALAGGGDPQVGRLYGEFGSELGIILQIRDDLEWLKILGSGSILEKPGQLRRNLPVIYCLEVSPDSVRQEIGRIIASPSLSDVDLRDLISLLDRSGTPLYIQMELVRHRSAGLAALERAGPREYARDILQRMLIEIADR